MNRENIIEILSKGVCINYETITQLFDENSIKDSFERLKSIQEGVSYAYKIPLNLFFDQFYTNTEVFCRFQLKRIYRMETVVVQKLTGKKGKRFYVKPTKHQKYMHSTKPLAFDLHKRLIALLLMQIEGMAVT